MQTGFDIDSLLRFTPPGYLCERCYALLVDVGRVVCPVCGVQYIATDRYPMPDEYLRAKGCEEGQGELFGKPMPAAQFEQLLALNQYSFAA